MKYIPAIDRTAAQTSTLTWLYERDRKTDTGGYSLSTSTTKRCQLQVLVNTKF
jgi:hypothetical protein